MNHNLPFSLDLKSELLLLQKEKNLTLVNVGNAAAKSFIISQIWEGSEFQNIFWASTEEQASDLFPSAGFFFGGKIHLISAKISLREYYRFVQHVHSKEKNLFLFEDLKEVLNSKFPTDKEIKDHQITLKTKQKIKVFELFAALENIGYVSAEDSILNPGEFIRKGENLFIFPVNTDACFHITLDGDEIERISIFDQGIVTKDGQDDSVQDSANKKFVGKCSETCTCKFIEIFPVKFNKMSGGLLDRIQGCERSLFISDDLDEEVCPDGDFLKLKFTTFPGENEKFFHLNFFSILPFYTMQDFVLEIKERFRREFSVVVVTKKCEEMESIFKEHEIMFTKNLDDDFPSTVKILDQGKEDFIPHSFQNNERKLLFLTDREIFQFARYSRKKKSVSGINLDLMTGLKSGDYIIHLDHGVGKFEGIIRRKLGEESNSTREYLKLAYAENDRLFVPVESAEKVTKFIGDNIPNLTKLGASDWKQSQQKLKKEAARIAKELLKLYAARELKRGKACVADDGMMEDFCAGFAHELTPGQLQSWNDVRRDLEKIKPMDRMVCGDVGFGKTEIAMRAAFKCFRSGGQAAILAPITILAEQHFQNFRKRIEGKEYGARVELLSRFQTVSEQKKILEDLELGLVDIVIGTHRLLSGDIKFKNLNLLVIDEEQRFGVQQKERLKKMRASVNILTMTATPIPRTLHMSLNHLKDISTITTPPPGRLPIVTEVRKFNLNLIRERMLFELKRGGQVYFLHNEVRTIESQTQQLRQLIPEAKFIVAHGQLSTPELEKRIRTFKEGDANVLVASTIIENGIDLPNANTLFVNRAEKFGLSQLYQLRGRVGRRRTQAYSFFLYHGQKLELEAKKRLRAIVEASELGSGFQIAMRDLEIRGAGEILGASQSGAMKNVGVSHFMRLLNKTVEEMKSGEISKEIEEEESISVEVPLSAFIPSNFIPDANEKIQVYKELAGVQTPEELVDIRKDIREDYGSIPIEVENLCKIISLKMLLRGAHLLGLKISKSSHKTHEIVLRMGNDFNPEQIFGLIKNSKNKWVVTAQALKLSLDKLPVSWYEDLVGEVGLLGGAKNDTTFQISLDNPRASL